MTKESLNFKYCKENKSISVEGILQKCLLYNLKSRRFAHTFPVMWTSQLVILNWGKKVVDMYGSSGGGVWEEPYTSPIIKGVNKWCFLLILKC